MYVIGFHVKSSELLEISKQLREVDRNKAQPEQIHLNYQGKAGGRFDMAPKKWAIFYNNSQSIN